MHPGPEGVHSPRDVILPPAPPLIPTYFPSLSPSPSPSLSPYWLLCAWRRRRKRRRRRGRRDVSPPLRPPKEGLDDGIVLRARVASDDGAETKQA